MLRGESLRKSAFCGDPKSNRGSAACTEDGQRIIDTFQNGGFEQHEQQISFERGELKVNNATSVIYLDSQIIFQGIPFR